MTRPIDKILSRLGEHQLRRNGPDRWRACCPAHGGSNPSSLSVGVADGDVVLLKCWVGCDSEAVVHALGLELSALFPPSPEGPPSGPPMKRRRLLGPQQALDLLHDEAQLVGVCAGNIAHGVMLSETDVARVLQAAGRIAYLRDEAMA